MLALSPTSAHTGAKPFACHCSKTFSRLDNLRSHCVKAHPLNKALNESTITTLRQQHTALASGSASELQKYAKVADESLGIKLRPKTVPRLAPDSASSEGESEQSIKDAHEPVAGPSSSRAKRKQVDPSDEDWSSQGVRPALKKTRRTWPKPRLAFSPSLGPGISVRRDSSRGPPSAAPPKPLAASRFKSVRRANLATSNVRSPFTPEIASPATPIDGRPSHLVKVRHDFNWSSQLILMPLSPFPLRPATQIAWSRDSGDAADSPYSAPRRFSRPFFDDKDDAQLPLRLKSSMARKEPARLSLSNDKHFSRRHFDEMKYDDASTASAEAGPLPLKRSALASHKRTDGPNPLLPAPVLANGSSSRPKVAAAAGARRPQQGQAHLRPPPAPAPTTSRPGHATHYQTYQAAPARRYTLPPQVSAKRHALSGWGDGPYTADYSLSSARTRMSSGVSHNRASSGAGATLGLGSFGYAAAPLWSMRAGASREEAWPYGPPLAPTPGRTVHSPEKPTSAPRARPTSEWNNSQSALMDVAVEMLRPRPLPPPRPVPVQVERSPSAEIGVLWGDPSQVGPAETDCPSAWSRHGGRNDASFVQVPAVLPMPQHVRRYESAFSPPPPPTPAYWLAPYHPAAYTAGPYAWHHHHPMHAPPPFAHFYAPPVVDYGPPPPPADYQYLSDGRPAFSGGPMLSALSPHGLIGTPPATTADFGSYDGHAYASGPSSFHPHRMMPTAQDAERVEPTGAQGFQSTFARALDGRDPQVESAVVSPAFADHLGPPTPCMRLPTLSPPAGSETSPNLTSASVFAKRVASLRIEIPSAPSLGSGGPTSAAADPFSAMQDSYLVNTGDGPGPDCGPSA